MRAIQGTGIDEAAILNRLKNYDLVSSDPSGALAIKLTPHGLDVARHVGGYLGYRAEEAAIQRQQQQAQADRDKIERETAKATVDGVRANWWAVRVSVIGLVIGTIFSIIATCQSRDTAAELDKTKVQLEALKRQLAHQKVNQ